MWINSEVQIPDDVLEALRSKKLVIFAGAGVSQGPPSNLPDFHKLAETIAGETIPEKERLDRRLGQIDEGKVQRLARAAIDNKESKPRDLHRLLVSLFPSAEFLRIVTTNFDRHFTTVAQEVHGPSVEIHYAPALPLGRDIRGIVYLHGSLDRSYDLVLTDRAFSQAYLIDGWATRFLVQMFREYCVLFLGYSHRDPVMEYVARGLPEGNRRFSLIGVDTDQRTRDEAESWWRYLGITPVLFPLRHGGDYGALDDAIRDWRALTTRNYLDHEERIKQLVSHPAQLNPGDQDYLRSVLRAPETAQFFVRYANNAAWLRWVEDEGALDRLFDPAATLNAVDELLSRWFADVFVIQDPQETLAVAQRKGLTLHDQFATDLSWSLKHAQPAAGVLVPWISILSSAPSKPNTGRDLTWLLSSVTADDALPSAILLFAHLTRPELKLSRGFTLENDEPSVHPDLQFIAESFQLDVSWKRIFMPRFESCALDLATMLAAHISRATHLLAGFHQDWPQFDQLSDARMEIGEGTGLDRPVDLFVRWSRDALHWLLANRPTEGRAVASQWIESGIPLLVRLAVDGLAHDPQLDGDLGLRLIRERHWLYAGSMKPEVFALLRQAYPRSETAARHVFVDYAANAPIPGSPGSNGLDSSESEAVAYERCNVAAWLTQSSPDCPIAEAFGRKLFQTCPKFVPREHPDRDVVFRIAESYSLVSPRTADELLAAPAATHGDYLRSYKGEGGFRGEVATRDGLLEAVTVAISRRFEWGADLAAFLCGVGDYTTDLWPAIFRGWEKVRPDAVQWERVFDPLTEPTRMTPAAIRAAAELLDRQLRHDAAQLTSDLFMRIPAIAEGLLFAYAETPADLDISSRRYERRVIDSPGWQLAAAILYALFKLVRKTFGSHQGIPSAFREVIERISKSDRAQARFASSLFASHIAFLFHLERDWTRATILPLFDWSNPDRAALSWKGFIRQGQWQDVIMSELLPSLTPGFGRILDQVGQHEDAIVDRLAGMAVFSTIHPWQSGWLPQFVSVASDSQRAHWCASLGRMVAGLSDDEKGAQWQGWLRSYWTDRLNSHPIPFGGRELEQMADWVFVLTPVVEEVVDFLVQGAPVLTEATRFFDLLKQSSLPESNASAIARLVEALLSRTPRLDYYALAELDPIVRRIHSAGASKLGVLRICDSLARLGLPSASELARLVQDNPSDTPE